MLKFAPLSSETIFFIFLKFAKVRPRFNNCGYLIIRGHGYASPHHPALQRPKTFIGLTHPTPVTATPHQLSTSITPPTSRKSYGRSCALCKAPEGIVTKAGTIVLWRSQDRGSFAACFLSGFMSPLGALQDAQNMSARMIP